MSGPIRRFAQGQIYHVYNRGNHREMIFRDNPDRIRFLSKLDEYAERHRLSILTYCLMDNHFHLLLRQDGVRPITQMMHALVTSHVRTLNKKYGLVGHLFQGPFQAKRIVDEGQLAWVSRYIHLNPAEHTDYRTYRWSSYRQFAEGKPGICDVGPVLDCFGGSKHSYAIYMRNGLKPGLAEKAPYTVEGSKSPVDTPALVR